MEAQRPNKGDGVDQGHDLTFADFLCLLTSQQEVDDTGDDSSHEGVHLI